MVNQLSPLRYPGGKAQLEPFVSALLSKQNMDKITYVEPFAGGAGLALSLLFSDNNVQQIIINDFDRAIYSVWDSILNNTEQFISKIKQTKISIEQWNFQKNIYSNGNKYSLLELGFATFFLNRTNRSGILKGGVIGGKNQDGNYTLDCRFNKDSLINKIINISHNRDKIKIYNIDALEFINTVIPLFNQNEIFIFFDPPYYKKGKGLYTNFFTHNDHEKLFDGIGKLNDYKWITTYDDCKEITNIFSKYKGFYYTLNYSLGNRKKAKELMFYNEAVGVIEEVSNNYLNISPISVSESRD